eukprot:c23128_g1_i1 orf=20-1630(+)
MRIKFWCAGNLKRCVRRCSLLCLHSRSDLSFCFAFEMARMVCHRMQMLRSTPKFPLRQTLCHLIGGQSSYSTWRIAARGWSLGGIYGFGFPQLVGVAGFHQHTQRFRDWGCGHRARVAGGIRGLHPFHGLDGLNTEFCYSVVGSSRELSSLTLDSAAKPAGSKELLLLSTRAKEILHSGRYYSRCYWELSKARLSMLVVATTGAGFVMGSGVPIYWADLSWTCLGTILVAAAANTINQILEVENDSKMKRTMQRPLPAGRIGAQHALSWALITGISGIFLLASKANLVAAGLGAGNLVLYTLVYTPLKRFHPINTWVGAIVGAIPPILGWAAAAGEVGLGACVLAGILYFWQIPHFMAVAHLCRDDYAAGGFKMLSILDSSGKKTALVALRNCVYLLPMGFVAFQLGMTSEWFGVETGMLTSGMIAMAALFYCNPSKERARKLFRGSLLYLPLLMAAMLFHHCPNQKADMLLKDEIRIEHLKDSDAKCVPTTAVAFEDIVMMDPLKHSSGNLYKPPVAFLSVAPFPFLPVPEYSSH